MEISNNSIAHQAPVNDPSMLEGYQGPYVRIVEQPARCALRFRYECEGRSAGSIPGASATPENKTYPTIQVHSFKGPAVVVVSCVTKDLPYRPHPHNLVGKDGCKKGVCTMVINNADMICSFTSLGIQCVKRKDIEESLKLRETIKVDPFRTGFSHKNQASNIDLNVVRLCFQVFLEGSEKDKFNVPLTPVVSEPIYDKKAMSDLIITKLSHCSAPVTGGRETILLCDRVAKDDIQIRFYEERNGQLIWEALGEFQPNDVHKQVAISFRTPKYYDENIPQPVTVCVQLRRPSDGHTSEPRQFQLLPKAVDPDGLARKRAKINENSALDKYLKDNPILITTPAPSVPTPMDYSGARSPFNMPERSSPRLPDKVKLETTDQQQRLQQQPQNINRWNQNDSNQQQPLTQGIPMMIPQSPYNCQNITPVPSPRPSPTSQIQNNPILISQQQMGHQAQNIPHPMQTLSHPMQSQHQSIPQTVMLDKDASQQPAISPRQHQQSPLNIAHSPNDNLGNHIIGQSYPIAQKNQTYNIPDVINDFGNNQHFNNNFSSELNEYLKTANINNTLSDHQQLANVAATAAVGNVGPSDVNANNEYSVHGDHHGENGITERLDSLDLLDASELLSDMSLNFSNIIGIMDSGNNITLNSSSSINVNMDLTSMQANTPHDNRAQNL